MATVKPTTVVVATHTPLEGDAICRFLETCEDVKVLAEVRSGQELQATTLRHRPDVVILNQRLALLGDIVDAVRSSPIPPERFVCMTSRDLKGRSVQVGLRQLGVRSLLSGEFGPSALLEAISRARPRPSVLCIRGLTGGAGQTTLALGILLGLCRLGFPVEVVDQGPRGDLTALLEGSPWLTARILADQGEGAHARLTVVDGLVRQEASREILVVPRTFGALRALDEPSQKEALLVDNAGVGSGRAMGAPFALMARLRPPLLEHPPEGIHDRRMGVLATLARRLATGGLDPGERSRIPRLFHGVQPR